MADPKDLYYVAVKVFLEHEGKLFIFKDKFGDWLKGVEEYLEIKRSGKLS